MSIRNLIIVLGDQLDIDAGVFGGMDPAEDAVVMVEAREEAAYINQHKKRLVLFFSAMRHFRDALRDRGWTVHYHAIDDESPAETLADGIARHGAQQLHVTLPGDWRVRKALRDRFPGIEIHSDTHFLTSPRAFHDWKSGRKRWILEDFYRWQRKETGLLMEGDKPLGGQWNFDHDNRKSFGRDGPGLTPGRPNSQPDAITREVMATVERLFPDAPGSTEGFAEPVSRASALAHLDQFIQARLVHFGDYQDAMATGHLTLWHSRLSAAMNLKMLNPREVIERAIAALDDGAPMNAVEGFVRQILGWREYIRNVYWTEMPDYAGLNGLDARAELPGFFWTGETEMACLSDGLGGLVQTGYAHHIQRLMVMGLFALLWRADPYRFHEWHMEMYLDAIDWVSLPNTLGMSQHADGGIVGTKPYTASGAYIDRMSDYCRGCRFSPKQSTGAEACPFTALYWDYLAHHGDRFRQNRRMQMQIRNLDRKDADEVRAIRQTADQIRKKVA
ncbi:MAG: cryptochrome/photolyase family protein [Pseudomonadota bacterium]